MSTNNAHDAITTARAAITAHAENARRLTVDAIVLAYNARMFNAARNLLQHSIRAGIIAEPRRSALMATCTRFNCVCPGGANIVDNGICWTYGHSHVSEPHADADEEPEDGEPEQAPAQGHQWVLGQGAGEPAPAEYGVGPALPGASGARL